MNTYISLPLLDVYSAHSALLVERAITSISALGESKVDLDRHIAKLSSTANAQDVREAVTAIRKVGYNVATEQYHLSATGISCAGCANKAGSILDKLTGVVSARVDYVSKKAVIEVVSGMLSLDDMLAVLKPAGYGLLREAASTTAASPQ